MTAAGGTARFENWTASIIQMLTCFLCSVFFFAALGIPRRSFQVPAGVAGEEGAEARLARSAV